MISLVQKVDQTTTKYLPSYACCTWKSRRKATKGNLDSNATATLPVLAE